MLKLMKYEFRKCRTTLMVMALALLALELWFLYGVRKGSDVALMGSTVLLTWLTFAVYAYLLIAAIVSYSRELRDKTGYLAFMAPVRPIGIVLSKLLFAALAAIVVTALFGGVAYMDYRALLRRANVGAAELQQANFLLNMFSDGAQLTVQDVGRLLLYVGAEALISMIGTACAAFLAITLSATALENRKGFLRGLLSFAFFALLTYGVNALVDGLDRAFGLRVDSSAGLSAVLGVSALVQLAACALFAWLSAWLLDRKVSL